jgi:hypothetical protein
VTGDVQGLQVSGLTIRQFAAHAIRFGRGVQAPQLSNLVLTNLGAAAIAVEDGVNNGSLEHVTLADSAKGGLDLTGATGWTVRLNVFRRLGGIAVAAHAGAADTTVAENLFEDCARAISFGLVNVADGVDHTGGTITGNTITGGSIAVIDSPKVAITHNTVRTAGTAAAAMTFRYDSTDLVVADNLTDAPLQARDGAWAIETGNVIDAAR